ncbi:YebC/PmpR family DNA-binding transcriptional regulator, partial [Escherichia sp. TWPC-MK]
NNITFFFSYITNINFSFKQNFNKKGGNIGAAGSVSYMFDNTGVIVFKGTDPDHIFEILLEAEVDVRDVTEEEGNIVIYT